LPSIYNYFEFRPGTPKIFMTIGEINGEYGVTGWGGNSEAFVKATGLFKRLSNEKGSSNQVDVMFDGTSYFLVTQIGDNEYVLGTIKQ